MISQKYEGTTSAKDWPTKDEAEEFKAYQFDLEDLLVLNIFPPSEYDENEYGGDTWANQVCSGFGDTLYAPDFDGTTSGNPNGINVLILRSDLGAWETSCKDLGCEIEYVWEVKPGHFGDGNWSGMDLAQTDSKFYWIEK